MMFLLATYKLLVMLSDYHWNIQIISNKIECLISIINNLNMMLKYEESWLLLTLSTACKYL